MRPAASRWTVGERVFVDRDVRQNLRGIELHCDSVRVMRTLGRGDDDATDDPGSDFKR